MIISPKPVARRWSAVKRGFRNFDVGEVANFDLSEIEEIRKSPGMIPNDKKIRATIKNAQEFASIRANCGSFEAYLYNFAQRDALIDDLDKRIHYIGRPSIRWFVELLCRYNTSVPSCKKP